MAGPYVSANVVGATRDQELYELSGLGPEDGQAPLDQAIEEAESVLDELRRMRHHRHEWNAYSVCSVCGADGAA